MITRVSHIPCTDTRHTLRHIRVTPGKLRATDFWGLSFEIFCVTEMKPEGPSKARTHEQTRTDCHQVAQVKFKASTLMLDQLCLLSVSVCLPLSPPGHFSSSLLLLSFFLSFFLSFSLLLLLLFLLLLFVLLLFLRSSSSSSLLLLIFTWGRYLHPACMHALTDRGKFAHTEKSARDFRDYSARGHADPDEPQRRARRAALYNCQAKVRRRAE
jgi:hypothetical protein